MTTVLSRFVFKKSCKLSPPTFFFFFITEKGSSAVFKSQIHIRLTYEKSSLKPIFKYLFEFSYITLPTATPSFYEKNNILPACSKFLPMYTANQNYQGRTPMINFLQFCITNSKLNNTSDYLA